MEKKILFRNFSLVLVLGMQSNLGISKTSEAPEGYEKWHGTNSLVKVGDKYFVPNIVGKNFKKGDITERCG